ncbi:xanthine dehydrogenase family protein molybdopterin-binding subunit [Pseudonocardia sulfidoxydans]|nr:xanthine dehydrogenase family protein molybdopterin-binding subunit [Pseudonocardia sulfidoxydans]
MQDTIGTLPLVGRALGRIEDRQLLSGTATFLDDIPIPGALHVAYVRSNVAHGTITAMDTRAARELTGVRAVITADDLDHVPPLVTPVANAANPPRHLLAKGVVRYVGEPIVAVVATSRYVAEDAAALVAVDIDPLPVVCTLAESLDPSKPVLHAGAGIDSNVLFDRVLESGDPDSAFQRAAHVIERTFRHSRVAPVPMETRGAAATIVEDELVLWASSQFPHALKETVSDLLGVEKVRVKCPDIGGGFGLKSLASPEEILVAWAAMYLNEPVKWVEDRSENLIASAHARDMEVSVRVAADHDGVLLAMEVDALCNTGAYSVHPITHTLEAAGVLSMTPGPYRLAHYRARARAMATNTCPAGPYRGVGLPVATLVHERVMDILADELGFSAVEIRRRNLITSDELPYLTATSQKYDSGDYVASLEAAAEMIGYDSFPSEQRAARSSGTLLGLGFATYVEWTGNNSKLFKQRGMTALKGWDSCQLDLDQDGRVSVWTSSPSIGQGTATTYAQVLADATGIAIDDIDIVQSDTGTGEVDGNGTGSSRSASVTSGAIILAGTELKSRLIEDAAALLDVPADELQIVDSEVSEHAGHERSIDVRILAGKADPGRYNIGRTFEADDVLYSYATHACRVSVDSETGEVDILQYVVAEDCGRVINPLIVEGQTKGALAQGIAAALYESFHYDEAGQPQTGSFMDYLVPTACELPRVTIRHLEIPAPNGILGAKGVGEGGTIAAGAAIANAVSNALASEHNTLPLRPEVLQGHARAIFENLH